MRYPGSGYDASWPASSIVEDFCMSDNAMLVGPEQGGVPAAPNRVCDASMMWSHLGAFETALVDAYNFVEE